MREIKFRFWDSRLQRMMASQTITELMKHNHYNLDNDVMQYTGLKDKNGIEIYEFVEIDNEWEVQYSNGSYVLINISNDDIITLHKYMEQQDGKVTVTKEYTKI